MKWRTVLTVVAAAAAIPACSLFGTIDFTGNGTGGGGGKSTTQSTGGAPSTSSTTTSSTTGTGGNTTSSSTTGTGGTGASACTAYMLERCKQMKACAPHVYAQAWDNDNTLCQSEAVRLCQPLPSAYDHTVPGVADAVACLAAISGSCGSYLNAVDRPPAACRPTPGTKTVDQGCLATAQCGAGLACFGSGPPSCSEYCGPVGTAGRACAPSGTPEDVLCDPRNGLHCVQGTAGNSGDSAFICRKVTSAALGASCTVNADAQCDGGLACSTTGTAVLKGTCVALLQEGAACTTTTLGANPQDPCDTRLGLSCKPTDLNHPTSGSACQPAYVVPDNATCGMVLDGSVLHNHVCGDYSYCNGSNLCQAKVMSGQGCVANGCYPPYQCTVGSCQAPTVAVDPPCSAMTNVPVSQIDCGPSPGQLPIACASACCYVGTSITNTCGAVSTCQSNSATELDCEDSSQCGAGTKCCLKFNPTNFAAPPVKAVCTATASCNGFEICRTDATSPCAGGTCTAASAVTMYSDWTVFLPGDVGFCKFPTCSAPNDNFACGGNSDCCSGVCDGSNSPHQGLCF